MCNITENVRNSRRGSGLYCVWVSVRDDGGDRLVATWIDRVLTAFKSCAPETSDGIGTAAAHFVGQKHEDVDMSCEEHLASILPRRS